MNQLIGNSQQGGCLNQPVPFKGYMNTPKHFWASEKVLSKVDHQKTLPVYSLLMKHPILLMKTIHIACGGFRLYGHVLQFSSHYIELYNTTNMRNI